MGVTAFLLIRNRLHNHLFELKTRPYPVLPVAAIFSNKPTNPKNEISDIDRYDPGGSRLAGV